MRRPRFLAVFAFLLALVPSHARPKGSFGDFMRAARALEEWQFDEAARLIAGLVQTAPHDPETRYLVAYAAFLEGDYARARTLLEDLTDDASVRELVQELKPLVTATYEATRNFARRDSADGHFTLLFQPGKDEWIVDLAGDALEAAFREINSDFGYTPPEKIRVEILPRVKDLARVSPLSEKEIETSGTIALCKYGKLMVVTPRATLLGYPWMDTLAHEYAHYVISRTTGNRVPIWLHEGLAKFEESRWRNAPGAPGMGRTSRHLLALAVKRGRLIRFEEMHPSMAKLPSQEAATTAFAEVYSLIAWVHARVGYAGIREALSKIRDGKSERRALAEVLGRPWEEVEAAWRKHLKGLGLEPDHGLVGGAATRRIRLRKSGNPDDDNDADNIGLDQVTEERARRLARLGGLLRARGRLRAAALEYEKALAALGAGVHDTFIAARLARTYLELGEAQKAIAVAAPLAERDEDDAGPQATLGLAYLMASDHGRAEVHLLAAVRVSPFDPSVRCGLGEVFSATGKAKLAEREQNACRALRMRR